MSGKRDKIKKLFISNELFHEKYIKNFKSNMSDIQFNKFRLYFLNIITEVKFKFLLYNQQLNTFFDNEKIIEKLLNLLQISFNIWNKISNDEKTKNDIFIFFFIGSCLILIEVNN